MNKKNLFLNENEIISCIKPYVIKEVNSNSESWKIFMSNSLKYWKLYRIRMFIKKLFLGTLKTVKRVNKEYTQVWNTNQYPGSKDIASSRFLLHHNKIYEVFGWGEKRVHLLMFSKLISQIKPKKYLEVGCGNGVMLMMLSLMHPEVEFIGIELTQSGIDAAKKMQGLNQLPKEILDFVPGLVKDPVAFKKIIFNQGNAADLLYADNEFDLVCTSLALEQMHAIQEEAIIELGRVSKKFIVMLEPFLDFNKTNLQKAHTSARNYLSLSVSDLARLGLNVLAVFDKFPCKITRGAGFVLAEKY